MPGNSARFSRLLSRLLAQTRMNYLFSSDYKWTLRAARGTQVERGLFIIWDADDERARLVDGPMPEGAAADD